MVVNNKAITCWKKKKKDVGKKEEENVKTKLRGERKADHKTLFFHHIFTKYFSLGLKRKIIWCAIADAAGAGTSRFLVYESVFLLLYVASK